MGAAARDEVISGFGVAVLLVGCGLWLCGKGIRNDIWIFNLGEAVIPRWMYIAGGIVCALAGLGLGWFLWPALTT